MELSRAESISLNAWWTWRTCEMTPSVVFSRFGWALSRWKGLSTEDVLLQYLPKTDPGSNNPQWIVVVVLPLSIFVFGRPRTLLIFSRKYKVAPNLLSTAFLFRFSFSLFLFVTFFFFSFFPFFFDLIWSWILKFWLNFAVKKWVAWATGAVLCTCQCKPRRGGECGQGVGIWQILKCFDQIPQGGKWKVHQKCQKKPPPQGKNLNKQYYNTI